MPMDAQQLLGGQQPVPQPQQGQGNSKPVAIAITGLNPNEMGKIQIKYDDGYTATETMQELVGMGIPQELIQQMGVVLMEVGQVVREFGNKQGQSPQPNPVPQGEPSGSPNPPY